MVRKGVRLVERVRWAERDGVGRGGLWWAEGAMGRESNRLQGAKRPFGRKRSEASC